MLRRIRDVLNKDVCLYLLVTELTLLELPELPSDY
jgi:hypothetical protein